MKRTFQMLLVLVILIGVQSCKGQSGKKQAEELQNKINGVMDAYHKPTSKSALYLEAKVDGKPWVADWMFIDPEPNKSFNVNAHKGDMETLSSHPEKNATLSFYITKDDVKGKGSRKFSENSNQLQFFEHENIMMGSEGEYHITNATAQWIEGTFQCKVKGLESGTIHQITDGFFRVSTPEKWKKDL